MSNRLGGSSCVSYKLPIKNPYKQNNKIYPLKVCILQPEGRLYCLYDTEIGGINSALKHILEHKE